MGQVSYGIQFQELAGVHDGPGEVPRPGQWLAAYDPDAHDGRGEAAWTDDVGRARRFADARDAFACWTATSTVRPRRADGKPNRPLTACTVAVEALP